VRIDGSPFTGPLTVSREAACIIWVDKAVEYSSNLNLLFDEACEHPVCKLQILTLGV
jgi:hypothetical protein